MIKVRIRCLDDLNVYGFSPIRLIKTNIMNRVLIIFDSPLIIVILVRRSCSIIIVIKIMIIWIFRGVFIQ